MATTGSLTVRISSSAHRALRLMAQADDEPMIETLEKAIEAFRPTRYLAALDADYARLRRDPAAWAEEAKELKEWDATLSMFARGAGVWFDNPHDAYVFEHAA